MTRRKASLGSALAGTAKSAIVAVIAATAIDRMSLVFATSCVFCSLSGLSNGEPTRGRAL